MTGVSAVTVRSFFVPIVQVLMADANGGLGVYSANNGTILTYVHASDDPGGIRRLVRRD